MSSDHDRDDRENRENVARVGRGFLDLARRSGNHELTLEQATARVAAARSTGDLKRANSNR